MEINDIDFEQVAACEYKRTVTMFGENTEKGRDKLKAEVEEIHTLFKDFVKENRPIVSLDEIATGEHWLAKRAFELKLVDELKTSDDYLLSLREESDIFEVKYSQKKRKFIDRITSSFSSILGNYNLIDENYSMNDKVALLNSKTDVHL